MALKLVLKDVDALGEEEHRKHLTVFRQLSTCQGTQQKFHCKGDLNRSQGDKLKSNLVIGTAHKGSHT